MSFQLYFNPNTDGSAIFEKEPYVLNGVKRVTFMDGYCKIELSDQRIIPISHYDCIKNNETGEVYVENGKWMLKKEDSK